MISLVIPNPYKGLVQFVSFVPNSAMSTGVITYQVKAKLLPTIETHQTMKMPQSLHF